MNVPCGDFDVLKWMIQEGFEFIGVIHNLAVKIKNIS
jgi:hypothetical protein